MRTAQSILALAIFGVIMSANFFWQLTPNWAAAGLAGIITIAACSALQRILANKAHDAFRKEYGRDWQ